MSIGSMEFIQQLTVVKTVAGNIRRYPFMERTDTLTYKSQVNGELVLVSGVEATLVASIVYLNSESEFRLLFDGDGSEALMYLDTSQFYYKGVEKSFNLLNLGSAPITVEYFAFELDE